MRLGQIARKLALRPSEIVEFLSKNNVQIEDNVNTRLEQDQVVLIFQRFAPEELMEKVVPEPTITLMEQPVIEPEAVENILPVNTDQHEAKADEVSVPEIQEAAPSAIENTEVIKAPKIELSGLKVLGKIDLPEPKKKEVALEPVEGVETTPIERKPRGEFKKNEDQRRPRRDSRPAKNPIAAQREREAREEEEKKKEFLEREKARKTQNYLRKVKMSPPTKAVKLINEEVEEMSEYDLKEEPKSWFGKFIKWLSN